MWILVGWCVCVGLVLFVLVVVDLLLFVVELS